MGGASSTSERVATRYGRALYGAAHAQASCDVVRHDCERLATLLEDVPTLRRFIANPTHRHDDKARAVSLVARQMKCHEVTARFLLVLAQRGRLGIFAIIARHFAALCDEENNVMTVAVTSAHPLTQQQQQQLVLLLSDYYGKSVTLALQLNESLLGGLRLEADHRLYDASVATALHDMTQQLEMKGMVS